MDPDNEPGKPAQTLPYVLIVIYIMTYRLITFRLAPEHELQSVLKYYYCLGLNDKKIAEQCLDHFDKTQYGLR